MAIIPVPEGMTFGKINSFILQRAGNVLRSKYTGQGQRIIYPFAVWTLSSNLNETDGILAGQIRSFLVKLEGQKNTFRLKVPGYFRPSTGYEGAVYTNGISYARASSIQVDGMPPNQPIFREGDYFTVNDELKMVTEDFATNINGGGVLSFKPALRKSIADNVALKIIDPTVLMNAAADDVASWGIGPPVRQSGKFEAIEAVEI